MPKSTVMKDKLTTALKDTSTGLTVVNKDTQERATRLKARFQRRLYVAPQPTTETEEETVEPEVIPEEPLQSETPPPEPEQVHPVQAEAPTLPPDLEWLEHPTPFSSNINQMVNRLRDARTRIAFTLEQTLGREKLARDVFDKAKAELDCIQTKLQSVRCQLGKIEDTIAGCALLAEQSNEIAELLAPKGKMDQSDPDKKKGCRPSSDDPTVCRKTDVMVFFRENPGKPYRALDVVKAMPPLKREHAKKSVSVTLNMLHREGKLKRVGEGLYQL